MAGARIRFKVNSRGVQDLLNSPGVVAENQRRGDAMASAASASGPVESGEYVGLMAAVPAQTDRAVVHVGSSAEHAAVVEAKTGNLTRALDAAR